MAGGKAPLRGLTQIILPTGGSEDLIKLSDDTTIVDKDGNVDAPITTSDLTTTGTTQLGDGTGDDTTISGDLTVDVNTTVTGTLLSTGLITATAGLTSVADVIVESGTAVPATAGAVAAGAPVTMYSTGIVIETTSDTPTHARPKGSICMNTGGSSTSTRMYVNTDGSTTWASFTTSA